MCACCEGLEDGTLSTADAYNIADQLDPILVYFIVRYLRELYPPTAPASSGVIDRLVQLTSTYPSVVQACKEGEKDPMREWYEDGYETRQYRDDATAYVSLIVEKLEG